MNERALTPQQEAELSQRLGQWRRAPLSPAELAALLPQVQDPALALALGERLGMAGPEAITLLLPLCSQQGLSLPLIKALGICHHPQARDQLLEWLPEAGPLEPAVLEALACWGNQIDLALIERALQAPGQAHRLAGLGLLTFRNRSLPVEQLLALTQPLLDDLRLEVVIATLRLLQRRDDPAVLAVIASCIRLDALPGVAEAAIQALGCIATPESCQLLIQQLPPLRATALEAPLRRQLEAQVRHRTLIAAQLAGLDLA